MEKRFILCASESKANSTKLQALFYVTSVWIYLFQVFRQHIYFIRFIYFLYFILKEVIYYEKDIFNNYDDFSMDFCVK